MWRIIKNIFIIFNDFMAENIRLQQNAFQIPPIVQFFNTLASCLCQILRYPPYQRGTLSSFN